MQQQQHRCLLLVLPRELLLIVLEYVNTLSHIALLDEALASSYSYRQRWLLFLERLKCAPFRNGVYKSLDAWQFAIKRKVNLKNAKFNVFGMNSEDSLFWACERGHYTVVHHVLTVLGQSTEFTKHDGETMLHAACRGGNVEIVRLLLDMGVNRVNEVGRVTRRPPLSYAVQSGSELPLLQLLLERGAVVDLKDRRGFTAFDYACLNGRIDIVCLFLKDSTTDPAAPDAAAPSPTPDQLDGEVVASKSEPASASCRLLLAFTDSGVQASNNPLVLAATNNHSHLVLWLLQAGVSIDSQGDLGDTALHCAAKLGHLQTVQALLDYTSTSTSTSPVGERGEVKVNVRSVNDLGNAPLHYAARNGHAAVVKLLIAHGAGADCLSPNKEMSTPLSLARKFRRNEVLACMGFGAEAQETGKSTSRLCFCFCL